MPEAEPARWALPREASRRGPSKPSWGGLLAVWLPGLYAWGACVAWPVFGARAASPLARVAAGCALICLLGGPAITERRPRLGRALGVLGFLGFGAAAWGSLGEDLGAHLDPVRGALGALAFGLFALGWGGLPGLPQFSEDDARATPGGLAPRSRLRRSTLLGFATLLLMALSLPLLAWRVERQGVALLAQAVALAGSLGLLSVGTRVLLAPRLLARPSAPLRWMSVLVVWLLLGGLAWLL